jgi:hypothetical protein
MQERSCDPDISMKLLIAFVALILIALSLVADYKWKRWIAARQQERDANPTSKS